MKKRILGILFLYLFLYILNFILIPLFFDSINGYSFMGLIDSQVSLILTFLFFLIAMRLFSDSLLLWWACGFFYLSLMLFYIPEGVYGIGMKGIFATVYDPEAVPFGISVVMALTYIEVFVAWAVVKLIKYAMRFKNPR